MTTFSFPTTSARPIDGATRIDLTFTSAMSKGSGSIFLTDGAVQTVIDRVTGEPKLRVVGGTFKKEISLDQVSISGNQVSFDAADLPPGVALNVYMGAGTLLSGGKAAGAITVPGSATFTAPAGPVGLSASIAIEGTTLKAGGDIDVTVSFSKAVSTLNLTAVAAEHANVTNLTHSEDMLTWTITLGAAGSVESLSNVLRLDMSKVTAEDGSTGSGTLSSPSYAVDTIVDAYIFPFLGVNDNGPSDEDGVTNDNEHYVGGGLMGALAADEHIELSINGIQIDPALIQLHGEADTWAWYYIPEGEAPTFAEGSNTVTARVVNTEGHSSATVTKTVVIDTDLPEIVSQPTIPVDASGNISFSFDEAMYLFEDVEVVNKIEAVDGFGNTSWIEVDNSMFSADRKTLTLSAEQHNLASGNSYKLSLPYGLTDLAGNEYAGDPITFSTAGDYQDKAPPRLLQVYIVNPDGAYGVGDVLVFRMQFSEKVNVDATAELVLDIESRMMAEYVGLVSDGMEIEFSYTIKAGDDVDVLDDVYHSYQLYGNVHDDDGNVFEREHVEYEGLTTADGSAPLVSIDTVAATPPGAPQLHADSEASAPGAGTTSDTTPRLTGSGAEAGAFISIYAGDVKVGAATADENGNWDTVLTGALSVGTHPITISQEDPAGNVSGLSSVFSLTIVSGPAPLTAPLLDSASDTGLSDSDRITKDDTPTIHGTGPASTTLKLNHNGAQIASVTTDGSGNWTTTLPSLAEGVHAFTVQQGDGDSSPALSVTVDLSISALGAPRLADGDDTGVSTSDGITRESALELVGSGAEAGAAIKILSGETVVGYGNADGSGNWNATLFAVEGGLVDGEYAYTVRQEDAAGNLSEVSAPLAITLDRTGPAASATPDLVLESDSGSSTTDNITNDNTPTFTGSGAVAGAEVVLLVDAVEVARGLADSTGNWTLTSTALADGSHQVQARYFDLAGNQAPDSAALSVTIDQVAPVASSGNLDSGMSKFLLPFSETIVFTPSGKFKMFKDGAEHDPYLGSNNSSWSVTADADGDMSVLNFNLSLNGLLKLQWTNGSVTDLAGNVAVIVGTPEWEFTVPATV